MKGNKMKLVQIIIVAATIIASTSIFAHSYNKPKHGGVVQEINEIQYELLAKPTTLSIYVYDHEKKMDAKGATAKVTLLNGAEKSEATLVHAGENKLEATGTFNVKSGTKAVAVVTLAGKGATSMRFVVQ
jgi:hypothetical protein